MSLDDRRAVFHHTSGFQYVDRVSECRVGRKAKEIYCTLLKYLYKHFLDTTRASLKTTRPKILIFHVYSLPR
jgi:hypothetical protein